MGLSKIEVYVFGGNCGHFVSAFDFVDQQIVVAFEPMESDRHDGATKVIAVFPDAVMTSVWEDPEERWEYPLDPIGFDSYPSGDRWKFVLHCDSIEWAWESVWPTLSLLLPK